MAEGWARYLKSDQIEAHSAGVKPHGLDPLAVKVMAEAGVDISGHRSKHVNELATLRFDHVVPLCADADKTCPTFPGRAKVIRVPFDDPPLMAKEAKTEEEALTHYRRVRDEIKAFIQRFPEVPSRTKR